MAVAAGGARDLPTLSAASGSYDPTPAGSRDASALDAAALGVRPALAAAADAAAAGGSVWSAGGAGGAAGRRPSLPRQNTCMDSEGAVRTPRH